MATQSVTNYINALPEPAQQIMNKLRRLVLDAAPEARELIRYGMPAFKLNDVVIIYIAAWKHHVGLYPIYMDLIPAELAQELAPYHDKGDTIKLPLDDDALPYTLVEKIIALRLTLCT